MILLLSRPIQKKTVSKKKASTNQNRNKANNQFFRLSSILNEFELTYNLGPELTQNQLLKLKTEFLKIVN